MRRTLPIQMLSLAAALAGCGGSSSDTGQAVTVTAEPAGANCPTGGQRIDITSDGTTTTTYVCNGSDGPAGTVTVTPEPPGSNCPSGGAKLEVGSGPPTYLCSSGSFTWAVLTADTQAQPNHGYVATASSTSTLTLPLSTALAPGDQVQLVDLGPAEVNVTPNAGQSFSYLADALGPAANWSETSAPSNSYVAVASSADGSKLVAAGGPLGVAGNLFTSTDSGATWTTASGPWGSWTGVASSADGSKLVAVSSGAIITSTDSGTSWTTTSAPAASWYGVASSADGSKLVAIDFGGGIWTSTDSGVSWTQTSAPSADWFSVASSADGSKLVASEIAAQSGFLSGGNIFTSTDSGTTWTQTSAPSANWFSVASSADGTKLVAVINPVNGGCTWWNPARDDPSTGGIWTSTDSGATWTQTRVPPDYWNSVASSADGSRLVAVRCESSADPESHDGYLYISTDSGTTWARTGAPLNWWSVASSADGSKLTALGGGLYGGGIYRSGTGSLVAHASSQLDLVSFGSDAFFVTGVRGVVEAP